MNKLKEFLLCIRPHSFPASIGPVLVGSSFSLKYVISFSWFKFAIFLLACILIQAGTNLFNEYYDFKNGIDKKDSQGISASIVNEKLKTNEVFLGACAVYLVALMLGIYLSSITSHYLLILGLVCMLAGYFYTGGKNPIAYTPYGEVTAGFFMGTVIACIAFYIQTGFVNVGIVLISLPLFLLIGAILLSNSIRDLDNDKLSGRYTYAISVGRRIAIFTLALSFVLVYILNMIYSITKIGSVYNLLVLITIPLAIKIVKGFLANNDKKTMAPYMVLTAKLTILISIIMSLAYLLDYIIK
ncbi:MULTISPECIES: 1,4-dihydroxy-2-naphthoate polyprenyltransferase [unclassified Gemella]|uniref:1,4-dihydroxy-2-naphthoate polyprenyltransferase n=1 Tax=unclassified Gemella TaxID=2624949 RepID=UPI001D163C3A|nr:MULTISPECIES: 1,4-dihydroxy-2-naphthoate polyprenyltransferase [unclassified Gemella]